VWTIRGGLLGALMCSALQYVRVESPTSPVDLGFKGAFVGAVSG